MELVSYMCIVRRLERVVVFFAYNVAYFLPLAMLEPEKKNSMSKKEMCVAMTVAKEHKSISILLIISPNAIKQQTRII